MNWLGTPSAEEPREATINVRARVRGIRYRVRPLRHAIFADVRGDILMVPNEIYRRHCIRYDSITIGRTPEWTTY